MVHTGDNCAADPCFLVEAGDNNSHAGLERRVDLYWAVQCTEGIPGKQEHSRNDAVRVHDGIVLEVDHALAAHQHHHHADEQQQDHTAHIQIAILMAVHICTQVLSKFKTGAGLAIPLKNAHTGCCRMNRHLVAFRHTSGRDIEPQLCS